MMKASLALFAAVIASIACPFEAFFIPTRTAPSPTTTRWVHTIRDADFYEMMMGGERYEMVPLPDSMMDTTIYVGNLNEFAHDEDLSQIFCQVTSLSSVPACVARKANMASLEYGFVTFPSVEEKDAAILRFHNSQFMGKRIEVEEIRDFPNQGRVRVPERMVSYVLGDLKKLSSRETNTMRRVTESTKTRTSVKKKGKKKRKNESRKLISYKLTDKEQSELQRAVRNGYVTLNGTGFRRGRKTCNLACAHRQWCDVTAAKPQIIHCKASGGRPLDNVIVDLSPLRSADDLTSWYEQIQAAAALAGMEFRADYVEDNCQKGLTASDLNLPTNQLPVISMGVFEGERRQAKIMVQDLANVWEVPSQEEVHVSSQQATGKANSKEKRKGRRNQRRKDKDFFF